MRCSREQFLRKPVANLILFRVCEPGFKRLDSFGIANFWTNDTTFKSANNRHPSHGTVIISVAAFRLVSKRAKWNSGSVESLLTTRAGSSTTTDTHVDPSSYCTSSSRRPIITAPTRKRCPLTPARQRARTKLLLSRDARKAGNPWTTARARAFISYSRRSGTRRLANWNTFLIIVRFIGVCQHGSFSRVCDNETINNTRCDNNT